jgi:DNA repair exonuclease SbcCD ATPase subunit
MTLDENIASLEAQIQTLEKMHARTKGAIEALERRLDAVENHVEEVRGRIRSLRRTLISAGSAPSEAAVRERLVLDERLQRRVSVLETFQSQVPEFAKLAVRWRDIQVRKKEFKETKVTGNDKRKLDRLEQLFLDALKQFGFESFPVESITLDRESYKPTRQGFDVLHDVSASDNIRVIAAYLTALLELSREFQTNHPGLLILDEPRQQNMKWSHFVKILERLATAAKWDQQVIIATSDRPERMTELGPEIVSRRVGVEFENWLIQKMV